MPGLRDQLELLEETEWDVLLILDALRWDYWDEMVGVGQPVRSPDSCTFEWIAALLRHQDFSDVSCITANPEVTRRANEMLFHSRDDVWSRAWEKVNGLGTVPPEKVTEAVESEIIVGPERRIYAHYAQPHGPYPTHDPPIPVMRNNPEAGDVDLEDDYMPDEIIMNPNDLLNDEDSWLSPEMLQDAYRTNLEWVWEAVQPVVERDLTVVVTGDHGEFLGEEIAAQISDGRTISKRLYGHPCGAEHDLLRKVPFVVYD